MRRASSNGKLFTNCCAISGCLQRVGFTNYCASSVKPFMVQIGKFKITEFALGMSIVEDGKFDMCIVFVWYRNRR